MAEFVNGKYVSPSGRVYYEAEEKRKAQKYAQEALEGKRGYVSASQLPNAIINAKVPINKTEIPVSAGSSGGGTDAAMQRYLNELSRQRAERQAMLDEQYNQGKKNIEDAAENSKKEAYVAYMHGIKNMPQAAAMYGSGGMAQSLANKSQLNYENNRNKIDAAKIAGLADLESDYRAGVMDAGENYLTRLSAVQGKGTAKSSGGKATTVAGYSIGNNKTVHTGSDEQALTGLINELMGMGFTRQQAEEYIKQQM